MTCFECHYHMKRIKEGWMSNGITCKYIYSHHGMEYVTSFLYPMGFGYFWRKVTGNQGTTIKYKYIYKYLQRVTSYAKSFGYKGFKRK